MAVFYNSRSGLYVVASPPSPNFYGQELLLHTGSGWHEYSSLQDMNAAITQNKWPAAKSGTSAKNLVPGAVTGAANTVAQAAGAATGSTGSSCLISLPSIAGGGCIFTKTNARAFVAGVLILAGAGLAVVGLVVLASQSRTGRAVVSAVPGGALASGVAGAFVRPPSDSEIAQMET